MADEIEVGQTWRHLKRGGVYEIIAVGCKAQASTFSPDAQREAEAADWVAYRRIDNTTLYFRPEDEFLDGRFELVEANHG